jgi:hypothetical protein
LSFLALLDTANGDICDLQTEINLQGDHLTHRGAMIRNTTRSSGIAGRTSCPLAENKSTHLISSGKTFAVEPHIQSIAIIVSECVRLQVSNRCNAVAAFGSHME